MKASVLFSAVLPPVIAGLLIVQYVPREYFADRRYIFGTLGGVLLRPVVEKFFTVPESYWSQKLEIDGLREPVKILRDGRGVPHIFAENDFDLLMAQGFVTATERWQVILYKAIAKGELSEIVGPAGLKIDRFFGAMDLAAIAKQSYEASSQNMKDLFESYAKGVNEGMRHLPVAPLEGKLLSIDLKKFQWEASDCVLMQLWMALQLNRGWPLDLTYSLLQTALPEDMFRDLAIQRDERVPSVNSEANEAVLYDKDGKRLAFPKLKVPSRAEGTLNLSHYLSLFSEDEILRAQRFSSTHTHAQQAEKEQVIFEDEGDAEEGDIKENSFESEDDVKEIPSLGKNVYDGSNGWAIAGKFTQSGKPILAGDMHLMHTAPGAFFPIFLESARGYSEGEEGYKAVGSSVPGIPGVMAGHSRYIALTFTLSYIDSDDLFEITLSDDHTAYRYGDTYLPLRKETKIAKVKGAAPVNMTILHTHYGPIVSDIIPGMPHLISNSNRVVALSTPLHRQRECYCNSLDLMSSKNWKGLLAMASINLCSHLAGTFADIEGNIGNFFTGLVPARSKVSNVGEGFDYRLRDGSDPALDWNSFLSPHLLPHYLNPQKGFVGAANSYVSPSSAEKFGTSFLPGNRQSRVHHLLEDEIAQIKMKKREKVSVEDFKKMQQDSFSLNDMDWKEVILNSSLALVDEKKQLSSSCVCKSALEEAQLGESWSAFIEWLKQWDGFVDSYEPFVTFLEVFIDTTSISIISNVDVHPVVKSNLLGNSFKGLPILTEYDVHIRGLFPVLLKKEHSAILSKIGGKEKILCEGLKESLKYVEKITGRKSIKVDWMAVRQTYFTSSISEGAPLLREIYNIGPIRRGGNFGTLSPVRIVPYDATIADHQRALERSFVGPSTRMVVDMGDFEASMLAVLPGVSGWPGSPHYRDQGKSVLEGNQLFPMLWYEESIRKASKSELKLVAKST